MKEIVADASVPSRARRETTDEEVARWERMDDATAAVYRVMTGAEKLEIASRLWRAKWRETYNDIRASHPAWTDKRCRQETAITISGGALKPYMISGGLDD